LDCGGDTDTTGAIAGALMGASMGREAIPQQWVEVICDQPRSVWVLTQVGQSLAEQKITGKIQGSVTYLWPLLAIRNAGFIRLVLLHGCRRLLPPY